jgi:hypothetical protein
MPQQPTVRGSAADPASTEPERTPPAHAPDLTVNKVLAGAGAAVTSAVLGSSFGATGTVAGAALGSVASTVGTTLYQRSLDRTRDSIVARVRNGAGRRTDPSDAPTVQLTVPRPRVSPDAATTRLRVEPALRRPRRIWLWAGVTALVFVIGLLAVTGMEWAKGSSLTTGQPGTSVGRVLDPAADRTQSSDQDTKESVSREPSPSAEPSTEPTPTDEPTPSEPTPSGEPTTEPTPTDEPTPSAEPSAPARETDHSGITTPLPTSKVPATGPNRASGVDEE